MSDPDPGGWRHDRRRGHCGRWILPSPNAGITVRIVCCRPRSHHGHHRAAHWAWTDGDRNPRKVVIACATTFPTTS
jgi:hypothetical protein